MVVADNGDPDPRPADPTASFMRSFGQSPHPMWIYDRDTLRFLRVNDAALAHYGYSREEFLTLTIVDIRPDAAVDDLPAMVETRRAEVKSVCIRQHRVRDGRLIDVDLISIALEGTSVLTIARDISDFMTAAREREQLLDAEREALAESERQRLLFRALFEGAPGQFLVIDPGEYRIVEVSDAYLRATMTNRQEIVGRPVFEVFPDDPDDPRATGTGNLKASLQRVVEHRRVDAMALQRYPVPRPEAQGGGFDERFWSVVNAPVLDEGGSVRLIIHRAEDVTAYVATLKAAGSFNEATIDRSALSMAAELVARAEEVQQLNRRLEQQDRLLAIAGRVARIGGWMVDLATAKVHWSDEVCALHEVQPGTVQSVAAAIDYYVAEYRPTIRERFSECAASGTPFDLELELESARGRRMWVRAIGEALRDNDRRIICVQGAFQDITAWKASQSDIARLANRLSTALDSMTDAFLTLDREWRITYMNRQAEILLQRTRTQLLGTILWDEFPEARGSIFETEYQRAAETREAAPFEAHFAPLSAWFNVRAFPSPDGLALYFRDVTAEHDTQKKLMQQASLLDQAHNAIIVMTLDGRITYCNRGAERLYGAEALASLAHGLAKDPAYGPALPVAVRDEVLRQGEWVGEVEQRRADGAAITVESHLTLVRDEQGTPSHILAINEDVTEHKKLQALIHRSQRLESIGTLAGGIAHDLNNVLTPIIMATSILKEEAVDSDTRDLLQTISESADQGAGLVRQVLAFARGVDGARVRIDLERVVMDVGRIMKETFSKNIVLRTHIGAGLWPLRGDPTQMHQVLLNLCVNARDAMPGGGVVTVSAENVEVDETYATMSPDAKPGPHVRIVVEDTGTGIPRAIADRVFDPFFTTKPVGEGSGLGLSTVASIVRGFGGHLSVYSEPGHGSSFRIHLPAASMHEAGEPRDAEPEEPAPPRGAGQLILVVDDEESVRAITRLALTAFGYQVITAIDGADAIATYACRGHEIDLVLSDMRMPVMDGPATVYALKRINPHVRIIAASGLAESWAESPFSGGGIRRFLEKPYTADRLLRAVHEALSEQE